MRVKIHHEGTNILIVTLIFILAGIVPLWIWVRPIAWPVASTLVLGVLYFLLVNFFRSPRRLFKGEETDVVVASADGKVVALEETFEDEYLHAPAIQLSVFMSILNVHANWFPGDEASIHDHMGFIKFGSRVDIYLPLGTETLVNIGDTTIGGVTEVGRLKPQKQ